MEQRFALGRGVRFSLTQDCISDPVYQCIPHLHSWKDNEPQQGNEPLGKGEDFTDENQLNTQLCPDTGLRGLYYFLPFALETTC